MREVALTTVDNPHDPFTDPDEWWAWDTRQGHNSYSLLARIANLADDLSEVDQTEQLEAVIDDIVRLNASGVHRKVVREIPDETMEDSSNVGETS